MTIQMILPIASLVVSVGLLVALVLVVLRYNRILRLHRRGMSINAKLIGGTRESIDLNAERIVLAAENVERNAEKIGRNETGVRQNAENIEHNSELIEANKKTIGACKEMVESCRDAISRMREQLFLYESRLSQQNGHWVLEHQGEKKYFEPGRIVKVESGDEDTEYTYDDRSVTCVLSRNGKKVSSHVFTLAGAPVSGEIYENGKCVRRFEYDELGQVRDVR